MTSTSSSASGDVGVGLISVGWMGKLHSRAYRALPTVYPELRLRPRLVHAADTAADRVSYARDVLGYAKGSTDYRAVLADADVDVVSICAPNVLHREIGLAAAEAGKHFWIEKPVGRDARETGEVAAAARKAGIVTSIGYNYRHAPAVEHVRELVAQGALGRITNVRAAFFTGYASEPKGALSWRFKRDLAGSGALGDLLSHVVDLVSYLIGPITEVSAVWNFEQMNELRICLGRGGPHQGYTTVLGNPHLGDYASFQPGPGIAMGYDDLKVIEAKKFLVAVTGGERRNSTVEDAHAVAEVIAAAGASATSGTWQAVPAVPGATFGREPAPAQGPTDG